MYQCPRRQVSVVDMGGWNREREFSYPSFAVVGCVQYKGIMYVISLTVCFSRKVRRRVISPCSQAFLYYCIFGW